MDPKKEQARNLFFQTDLTQTQIAELLDVNRKTIYLWAKDGAWQKAKAAARHMPSMLVSQYYAQLGALNEAIYNREERPYPTREEAEIQRKLTLTIAQLQKRLGTVERVEEMTLFVEHVMKEDYDLGIRIAEQAHKYIHDTKPGDVVTGILTQHKRGQQADQEFINKYSNQNKIDPDAHLNSVDPSAGWGTNGVYEDEAKISAKTATGKESIANCASHAMPHSVNQNNEASEGKQPIDNIFPSSGEHLGEALPYDEFTLWYQYLDKKYNISQDPHIVYRRGVYCIKPQSPLWGLGRSLF